MAKVTVYIEEHLVKEVVVETPDGLTEDEAMEFAEDKVKKDFDNGDIVLTADDFSGIRLWMTEHENGTSTNWRDM